MKRLQNSIITTITTPLLKNNFFFKILNLGGGISNKLAQVAVVRIYKRLRKKSI